MYRIYPAIEVCAGRRSRHVDGRLVDVRFGDQLRGQNGCVVATTYQHTALHTRHPVLRVRCVVRREDDNLSASTSPPQDLNSAFQRNLFLF